jgi:hypothetical protein
MSCRVLLNPVAIILIAALLIVIGCRSPLKQSLSPESAQLAPLIDPAKLATLGERGANPRIQKAVAILLAAKSNGQNPERIVADSITRIGWADTMKGELTAESLLRNVTIAERLGTTTPTDIETMRKGNCGTVRNGPYAGEPLSVDHIIPRSIAPELDNVIANLELMPLTLNKRKQDKIGERQIALGRKFKEAGLVKSLEIR